MGRERFKYLLSGLLSLPIKNYRIRMINKSLVNCTPSNLIKFLIISEPRSGSNLFCGLLNSHAQIVCFHELFHRNDIFYGPTNIGHYNFGDLSERKRDPSGFLKQVFSLNHGFTAVGFKIFYGHNNIVLSALARNRDIKKIFLNRYAELHAFTSLEIARLSNEYQVLDGKHPGKKKSRRIDVDIGKFKAFVDSRINNRERMLALIGNQDYLSLDYTDIVRQSNLYKSVLGFIGVDQGAELKANYRKQNPTKLKNRIANYDELSTRLANTKYEKYLKEEF